MKKLLFALAMLLLLPTCKKDVCDDIVCQNGGECLNGLCSCPDGYEGTACEKQTTPNQIVITQSTVEFKNYPVVNSSGGSWDLLDGADPLFTITDLGTGDLVFYSEQTFNNVSGEVLSYTHNSITLNNPSNRFSIRLFDEDFNDLDYMGGIETFLYDSNSGFPKTIELEVPQMTISFDVTYRF